MQASRQCAHFEAFIWAKCRSQFARVRLEIANLTSLICSERTEMIVQTQESVLLTAEAVRIVLRMLGQPMEFQWWVYGHVKGIALEGAYPLLGKCIEPCICIYYDAWGLDELEKTLEQIKSYNLRLPTLDDIRNLIHRRTVHEKIDKEGNTIHKLPNQIKTNELFDHLRPCELVIRENVYSAIGNRDHTQAVIALMLYCLENRQPFNLAYFIIRRMYFFRDRRDKVLPYGMILTLLFKNLKANMAQGSFDDVLKLVPRKMSSLKLQNNPRSLHPKELGM
ncbi:hypothetical protein Tco_0381788 [Tanacetum coccineum]